MAKDFLGNEIHVGDVVCYVDHTMTKSWMDIARIAKINESGVTLKFIEGLTKAHPSNFKQDLYGYKDGKYQKVGENIGRYKKFDKIVKYFPFPDSIEKEKPHSIKDSEISDSIKKEKPHSIKDLEKRSRYLRIEAEDPFYEEEFIDNKETNIYAALSNENSSGIEVCIDLKTHKIVEPEKVPDGNLYIKSCDTGTYTLMDEDFFPIAEMSGYGPNKLIPPSDGYGDYIDLKVKDNVIVNWYEYPSFEEFRSSIK